MAKKTAARQSVYECIRDHVKDGVLPDDFRLPQEEESDLNFAPGAQDGIYVFHVPTRETSEEDQQSIEDFLRAASDDQFEKAEDIVIALSRKTRAMTLMAAMQQYVADHLDTLKPESLFNFACWLLETTTDKEAVKFGFALSDLFECRDEGFRDTIRTLGLYEEYTLYASISMLMWYNGNEEIFNLAKKTRGWGRIHAVDRLAPETEEIRDWLFYEGIKNTVLPGYSVFPVFIKSGCEQRLQEKMDRKDFEAATAIIEAFLYDEPVPGISSLANAGDILKKFLARAAEQELNRVDRLMIGEIREFAQSKEHPFKDIVKECDALLK